MDKWSHGIVRVCFPLLLETAELDDGMIYRTGRLGATEK